MLSLAQTFSSGRLFRRLSLLFVVSVAFANVASAVTSVTSPTTGWTEIKYGNNNPDPFDDQQTGSQEGDIVGNAAHPSVYTGFYNAGTPSLTDGTVFFRIRLGADSSPAGFKAALFVGIDANRDGALDLFLGINNSGSADKVGIWNPGTGLNTSPSTTTIVSTPLVSYVPTSTNYDWSAVTLTNDPTVGTFTDLDGKGDNDYFLTFSIAFTDVVSQLALKGITNVNENSTFSYVVSTATQANSLNQDLNGVGKNYLGSATWSELGVQSDAISASGVLLPVPEPNIWAYVGLGFVGLAIFRRRGSMQ